VVEFADVIPLLQEQWRRSRGAHTRPAAVPLLPATSSTTSRTKRAAEPACATADPNAGMSTGSNSTRWNVEQITPGTFRWTAPSGRQYTTEPTRYPILSRVPWGRPFRWISSCTRQERANGHDRGRSTLRYRGASPAVRGQRRAPPPGHGVRRGSDDRTATGRSDAAGWGSAERRPASPHWPGSSRHDQIDRPRLRTGRRKHRPTPWAPRRLSRLTDIRSSCP